MAIRTGVAQGVASALNSKAAVATLPAVNRPRPKPSSAPTSQQQQHAKDKTENQLQALSKYSSRLRNLDMPYDLGVGVNRKGPSATANMKDKSDRATSEQVLDPRTRIILFKMIGRGFIYEVNGCVSTGKEVGEREFSECIRETNVVVRRMSITHSLQSTSTSLSRYTRLPFLCSRTGIAMSPGSSVSAEAIGKEYYRAGT